MAATLAPPLLRINTVLLSEARADCRNPMTCGQQDCCTTQDNCGVTDTTGHTCTTKDICDTDASGDCINDQCQQDVSLSCENDSCNQDSSGTCKTDQCQGDSSGGCTVDSCTSDRSGGCTNDQCQDDSSSSCLVDACISDKSGACLSDQCESDSSGACDTDLCISDASGTCKTDQCKSDNSGSCTDDRCEIDASASCQTDHCNGDYSGACDKDVCLLDLSSNCDNDLCREDRTPVICETDISCTNDTCSLDLAQNIHKGRREFAEAGFNRAIKWLYRLSAIVLFIAFSQNTSIAATVIDSRNAVLSPTPTYNTGQAVSVPNPVGPFLRDCDGDGILEADTNGDGRCEGDPKLMVMENTGEATKGLPSGTAFTGTFEFTCFYVPSDVVLIATGPLTVKASKEVAVFGAVRLPNGAEISTPAKIDLRTSAWLSDLDISFITALSGEVDEAQTPYAQEDSVPPVQYNTICGPQTLWLPMILREP